KVGLFRKTWEEYFEKSVDGRAALNTVLSGPYVAGEINGEVRDKYSQHIIPNFTARSIERGFVQHVTDDGRFYFLYDDGPTRGTNEDVTIIFSAPGYVPDTLSTNITYGATQRYVGLPGGIFLKPVPTDAGDLPTLTELHANHPNPFNPETTIEYSLGLAGPVRIRVFDAAGHLVRTLVDGAEAKGAHRVVFDGRDDRGQQLASGVYLYRLDTALTTLTRKMVLLK
ncbi:MAG TPA: FlgD immunoglobulin-like domain containing protein, partial [Candidatus Krumholzibacteria bacterium]|nr:FlgD immunoglobulin-like domain containing protein [Candidatus Krumholzibacteria bacterium]